MYICSRNLYYFLRLFLIIVILSNILIHCTYCYYDKLEIFVRNVCAIFTFGSSFCNVVLYKNLFNILLDCAFLKQYF